MKYSKLFFLCIWVFFYLNCTEERGLVIVNHCIPSNAQGMLWYFDDSLVTLKTTFDSSFHIGIRLRSEKYLGKRDSLQPLYGDTLFYKSDVYKAKGDCLFGTGYAYRNALVDTVLNVTLVALEPYLGYSKGDTLNKTVEIQYFPNQHIIESGYTYESYKKRFQETLQSFNQKKHPILVPWIELIFPTFSPKGSYRFRLDVMTSGENLSKEFTKVFE